MRPDEFGLFLTWVNHREVVPLWYGRKMTEEELRAEYVDVVRMGILETDFRSTE